MPHGETQKRTDWVGIEQDDASPVSSRTWRFDYGRRPLLSLLIAAIIPVLLFGGWVTYLTADHERSDARRAAFETVRHVAERAASEVLLQLQIAETLAASSALDEPSLETFYRDAERIRAVHPLWETIEIADPSGTQVMNLLRPLGVPLGPTADRESFDEVVRTRQPAVGGIGPVGQISGKRLVAIRAPVIRNGVLRYVLTVSFAPNAVGSILKDAGAPKDWVGVVVDARGNIIARTVAEDLELGRPASVGVREAIRRAPNGFYIATTLEGVQVETVYRTLPNTGGWSVHFGVPSDTLNAPVSRSILVLIGGGVASLVLALTVASLMARDIAQRRRDDAERSALALAVSEERGSVAVEAAELGTWRWDAEREEVAGSERCWTLLGLAHRAAAGSEARMPTGRFLEAVHPEDRGHVQDGIRSCLSKGSTVNVEFRVLHPDERVCWVRATGRIPNLNGQHTRVIHGVIADIEPQKRAEEERVHLLRRLSEAQENEQRRIARELHDQVGQTVTGLSLGLKALEHMLEGRAAEHVRWLQSLTTELGRDIHRTAADLRPTALDDLGLDEALAALGSEWSERFGIAADIQFIGSAARLDPEIETVVYRVIQEALTNVLKHAQATAVSIVIERRAHLLRVIVEDDGIGFDPEAVNHAPQEESRRERRPLGLSGVCERLALVNGILTVESTPGEGTTLFIQIPLLQPEPNT